MRAALVLCLAVLSGCVAAPTVPTLAPDEADVAAPDASADAGPPEVALHLVLERPTGAPRILARATAQNVADHAVQVWWPPCSTPIRMGVVTQRWGVVTPQEPDCPPQRACIGPCAGWEEQLQEYDPAPDREFAPGETLEQSFEFEGWITPFENPQCLHVGEHQIAATIGWYGASDLQHRENFTWSSDDYLMTCDGGERAAEVSLSFTLQTNPVGNYSVAFTLENDREASIWFHPGAVRLLVNDEGASWEFRGRPEVASASALAEVPAGGTWTGTIPDLQEYEAGVLQAGAHSVSLTTIWASYRDEGDYMRREAAFDDRHYSVSADAKMEWPAPRS